MPLTPTPGDVQGALGGQTFLDNNGNGQFDLAEPGLQNWVVTLFIGACALHTPVPLATAVTDSVGSWSLPDSVFSGLDGGTTFCFREVVQPGFVQTAPNGSYPTPIPAATTTPGTPVTIAHVSGTSWEVTLFQTDLNGGLDFGNWPNTPTPGKIVTATITATATSTPTRTSTVSATPTASPTATAVPSPTGTPTPSPTKTGAGPCDDPPCRRS